MRLLPFDYAFRNIGRRPLRSALAAISGALVAAVLVASAAFVQGLETANLGAAPPRTGILLASSAQRDLVRSAISPATGNFAAADVRGVARINGEAAVSPEIHMASNVRLKKLGTSVYPAFLRGITNRAFLVHDRVTITKGRPPLSGEIAIGKLVADKMGLSRDDINLGDTIMIEGGPFTVSGIFSAPGTTVESEIWVPLDELKGLAKRDDISCVFVKVESDDDLAELDLFSKRRLDLELSFISASDYYQELASLFDPLKVLAWIMAGMIGIAAVFGGANTLNAAVQDRIRELATLRALGYSGFALALSLAQEALLFSAIGGLLGLFVAKLAVARATVNLAMTAFALEVDGTAVVIGFMGVLAVALMGTIPAAIRVMRLPIATALKED
ncbi:MAG: ABC transporter permease [Planctomycetota bacterium]